MDALDFFSDVAFYISEAFKFLTDYGVFTLFNMSFSFYDILVFLLIGGAVCYVLASIFSKQ